MATETQEGAAPINMAQAKAVAWHEINTRQPEAAVRFYTGLFGWGSQAFPMGEYGDYTMFTVDGMSFCGVSDMNKQDSGPGTPAHWSTFFNIDDVDAGVQRATDLGGKVLVPPMDVPTVGRMSLVQDPEGAVFWLFKEAPKEG